MKNKLLIPIVLILWTSLIFSQPVSINMDHSAPAPSAILDVTSTEKGILIPRMTTVQRISIFD